MAEPLAQSEAVLEVISPDGARNYVRITQTPVLLGRGAETGNHLQLTDCALPCMYRSGWLFCQGSGTC
jgi:hypothetical protein